MNTKDNKSIGNSYGWWGKEDLFYSDEKKL